MANPNKLVDIIDVEVTIRENVPSASSFNEPLLVATFAANPSFPDRIKNYEGAPSVIKAALTNDGFADDSPTYQMVSRVVDQVGATRSVWVGRRDPGDANLVDALDAIAAENDEDWYHVYPDPDATTNAEFNAASAWMEDQFGFLHVDTASTAVANNTPGNLAATVLAAQRQRTVINWHDPATASAYGPAILRSGLGPFAVPDGSEVELRIDGGATQVFAFASTAATDTGSLTEDFVITDGDDMVVVIDGGDAQTLTVSLTKAAVTCANAETYNFSDGMTLSVRKDGAAAAIATFNGTAGSLDLANEPYAPVAATTTFSIDGGINQIVDWTGVTTAALAKTALDAQLTGVTTTIIAGPAVRITSNRLGTSSNVEVVANAGNALAEFGTTVGDNFGTGFAAFLDAATAAEVAAEIVADLGPVEASDEGGFVRVRSDTEGTSSRIQVTGGSANAVLGFSTNEFSGAGDFADGSAVSAAEVATWVNNNSFGVTSTVDTGAVVLTSDTAGSASQIEFVSGSLLATLGFVVGSTLGTGFAANAAAAEASEVATLISLTLTDGSSNSASNRVVLTSTSQGATASIEIVGGDVAAIIFGDGEFAAGTGVQQDYLGAAVIGRGVAFKIDRPNGNATWDNMGNLVGVYADSPKVVGAFRSTLDTLRVNTYEQRQKTRAEYHKGVVCRNVNGLHRYIDQAVSADWLDAALTFAIKKVLDDASDAGTSVPYTDAGFISIGSVMRGVLNTSAINGHTIFDDSTIDPATPNDTGIFVPRRADMTIEDADLRKIVGLLAVQQLRNAVQSAIVRLDLTNVLAG